MNPTLAGSFGILNSHEKRKLFLISISQLLFSLLDLAGVALIGVLASLAVNGVNYKSPGERARSILGFLHLDTIPLQEQALILGLSACFLLVLKTILSILVLRKATFFIGHVGAKLSSNLIGKLLNSEVTTLQTKSLQQRMYSVTSGVDALTLGIISPSIQIASDTFLLIVLGIGLFLVDPIMTIAMVLVFGSILIITYQLLSVKSRNLGLNQAEISIEIAEKISEVTLSYREILVRNRRMNYSESISNARFKLSNIVSERAFMPNISKYVIEISVIVGSVAIAAIQFMLNDVSKAVTILSVFLAASTRITPALLRIQQGLLTIKGSAGAAVPTLELIEEIKDLSSPEYIPREYEFDHKGFDSSIQLTDVSYSYPDSQKETLKNINLKIQQGAFVAIVGPSGAGKSTLVDLILGIVTPSRGLVAIGGLNPLESIEKWPGAIGYVPQEVNATNGSLESNIILGFSDEKYPISRLEDSIRMSQLTDFVDKLENGVYSRIGDRGSKVSGGEKQRIGIARALFTNPRILVLDEATSSLDSETENLISKSIDALKGDTTLIVIAHRLSTVKEADVVVYLEDGEIAAIGNFSDIRRSVPNFHNQANLMGL